jgi:hypothetical protein
MVMERKRRLSISDQLAAVDHSELVDRIRDKHAMGGLRGAERRIFWDQVTRSPDDDAPTTGPCSCPLVVSPQRRDEDHHANGERCPDRREHHPPRQAGDVRQSQRGEQRGQQDDDDDGAPVVTQ